MVSIISAMTRNRVIGRHGKMPWSIPEETKLFKKTTLGATVIMGRKTFESIGILNGRKNIIVSRTMDRIDGADVCQSLEEALEKARSYGREIFIIGGGEIFSQAIGIADKMYLSFIKKEYSGDTFFPKFNEKDWIVEARKEYKDFERVIYVRK